MPFGGGGETGWRVQLDGAIAFLISEVKNTFSSTYRMCNHSACVPLDQMSLPWDLISQIHDPFKILFPMAPPKILTILYSGHT